MKEALEALERYFQLIEERNEYDRINNNPEWDKGYQAAMAIIRGQL